MDVGPGVEPRLVAVWLLTAVIHTVITVAYAARTAGVGVRRLALASALASNLLLVARFAVFFQQPLLAKMVEDTLHRAAGMDRPDPLLLRELNVRLRTVLLAATAGAAAGIGLLPGAERAFARAVRAFERHRSIPRLVVRGFRWHWWPHAVRGLVHRWPPEVSTPAGIPPGLLVANIVVVAVYTCGVVAAVYAGALVPEYRATAGVLAGVVTGIGTVLMATVVDPVASLITDEGLVGTRPTGEVRRLVFWLVVTRLGGTLLAQLLFLPGAEFIAWLARRL